MDITQKNLCGRTYLFLKYVVSITCVYWLKAFTVIA